jgi:hypothetical protein
MDKILVLTGPDLTQRVGKSFNSGPTISIDYRWLLIGIAQSLFLFLLAAQITFSCLGYMMQWHHFLWCSQQFQSPVLVGFVNEACKKTCPTYNTSFLFLFLSDANPVVCLFPSRDSRYPIVIKSPTGKAVTADCWMYVYSYVCVAIDVPYKKS